MRRLLRLVILGKNNFDRCDRKLYKDTNIYAIPSNLELLLSILIGIIEDTEV
jgi:hypothetical protein